MLAADAEKPLVLVLIIGETARSASFSLYGYERTTNPALSKRQDLVIFNPMQSCGTSTAISMPCMFSILDRKNYSHKAGAAHENLLPLLARTGYEVRWLDNNTGDKGLAKGLDKRHFNKIKDPDHCFKGECRDSILLKQLRQELKTIKGNSLIVLHQIGSHGPAYWMRYSADLAPFQPACTTANFAECSKQEIINAYDNSIFYTDQVLADTIDLLAAQGNLTAAMLYVSDHGESLGENGVYLHGAPYFLAPSEQTQVPWINWFSPSYQQYMGLNLSCLQARANQGYSHDNLFHGLLTLTDVKTEIYKAGLDPYGPCMEKSP